MVSMLIVARPTVCPSGAARATASAAMKPFAPERVSTITTCPSTGLSASDRMRQTMSADPPAANPFISRISRVGCQPDWARARRGRPAARIAPAISARRRSELSKLDVIFPQVPQCMSKRRDCLLRLQAGAPDQLAPFAQFRRYEIGNRLRRFAAAGFEPNVTQPLFHFRLRQNLADSGIENPD